MFAGIALGKDLTPILVMLEGHALVAVSLDDGRRTATDMPRRNREGPWLQQGVLRDAQVLRTLIDEGHYIAIECTGFADGAVFDASMPEGANRSRGKLTFGSAVIAGRKQLELTERPFRFALDVAVLRDGCGFFVYASGLSGAYEERLIESMQARGLLQTADTAGLQRRVIITLARSLKRDVADFDQAVVELEHAVRLALEAIARGEHSTGVDEFVHKILSRIADGTKIGNFDNNARTVDEALAELDKREGEHRAAARRARIALLDAAVEQEKLRRNPVAVAARIAARVAVEHPTERPAWSPEFRREYDCYCENGYTTGVGLLLSVAAELARLMVATALESQERGTALHLLGVALSKLGERDAETQRLEEAVRAFQAALGERLRERTPLDWAATQNDLGNTLLELGHREASKARLEEAASSYRAALEVRTREQLPIDWAGTKTNLGNALFELGVREAGKTLLEEASCVFREALREYSRERTPIVLPTLDERTRNEVPLNWAATQNNLGEALLAIGERESGTQRLEDAKSAFLAALGEYTRERVLRLWAIAQNNLGEALLALGERETGTAQLKEAISAFEAALTERERERAPLEWATTVNSRAIALSLLGQRESDSARLKEAVRAHESALEVRKRESTPLDWGASQNDLGDALQALSEFETEATHLTEAVRAYQAALEERKRERVPFDWAVTQKNRGNALLKLGERQPGAAPECLEEAGRAYRGALEIFIPAGTDRYIATCRGGLERALRLLDDGR